MRAHKLVGWLGGRLVTPNSVQALFADEWNISQREMLGLDFLKLGALGGPQALLTKKGLLEMLTSASRLLAFAFFPFDIFRIKQ